MFNNTFMDDIQDGVIASYNGEDGDFDNAIGLFKRLAENRKKKVEARQEKKQVRQAARTERKAARTENIRSKAQSRITLANQGIKSDGAASIVGSIAQGLSGIGNIVGQVTGAGVQQQIGNAVDQQTTDAAAVYQAQFPQQGAYPQQPYATQPYIQQNADGSYPPATAPLTDEEKKKKTTMYMIIGGVVLAVIIAAVVLTRSKISK